MNLAAGYLLARYSLKQTCLVTSQAHEKCSECK
jgi:hypothetical protein